MAQDVKDYVKGCADCQRNKVNNQARKVLRHGRDVHPTWVKLFTETLSNKGSEYKGKVRRGL